MVTLMGSDHYSNYSLTLNSEMYNPANSELRSFYQHYEKRELGEGMKTKSTPPKRQGKVCVIRHATKPRDTRGRTTRT